MARLAENSYGKSAVRVTKVVRHSDHHELFEIDARIVLRGAFEKSYLTGDNSQVVATDTMKNTVYALAKKHAFSSIEEFGAILGKHFVSNNAHVSSAVTTLSQHTWTRINNSPIAFEGSSQEVRTATVTTSRDGSELVTHTTSGLDQLMVLKTTDSGFVGFLRDSYTTLPEVKDRIVATMVQATWDYSGLPADPNAAHAKARAAMLNVFAKNFSDAVQQTIFQMGEAVLAAVPEIARMTITLPNKHRIPANLKPLGMEFENDIYVTTDEPYGDISGTIVRD